MTQAGLTPWHANAIRIAQQIRKAGWPGAIIQVGGTLLLPGNAGPFFAAHAPANESGAA